MPSQRAPMRCWRGKLPRTRCATCAGPRNCVDYAQRCPRGTGGPGAGPRAGPATSTRRQATVSATAGQAADGVRSLADRFGIEPGMVVMEMGYDDDVDEDLRDALTERCGELVDEDTDEVVDAVLLWYRDGDRSEEHTSELQSRQYLVCRLLLEKKNNPISATDNKLLSLR